MSKYPLKNTTPVFKKVQSIYQDRLRSFTGDGQYKHLNLPAVYDLAVDNSDAAVQLEVYSVPDVNDRPLFKAVVGDPKTKWRPAKRGESFGPSWSTHWFKITVKVPPGDPWKSASGSGTQKTLSRSSSTPVLFRWNADTEAMIYLPDGSIQVGLSGSERREWPLPSSFLDNKPHTFYLEMACNGMFGNGVPDDIHPPDNNKYFTLKTAELVVPNLEARALHIDFWIIGDAARELPEDTWQKHKAREVANLIMDTFDINNPKESIAKCREISKEFLGEDVDTAKVYDSKPRNIRDQVEVTAIGNCHIDTAWLWPYAETRRKIARSWASQLELLEKYPEYVFAASQAQQFDWLLQDHPDLFKRVQKAAKEGRFIPVGGSWVENDTNMPTGESIVRQFLLGQRFFQQHFGTKSRTFWLPDTFGYSAQIPQLCRGAGMDRFLTQKLSWNNINKFPNSTFNWVALDGSQVLCHMPPDDTYTAGAHFGDVVRSLSQNKNKDLTHSGMLLYGHGDGGGGPTAEMLEKLRRCRGMSDTVGMLPRVGSGATVDEFYDEIEKSTDNGKQLVTWMGELYFEFHRGTYTSQSDTKKHNRRSEIILHDLEFYSALASISDPDFKYPKKEIDDLWKDVCLNQFHDVLPGSSIEMVYDDVNKIYKDLYKRAHVLTNKALLKLGLSERKVGTDDELVAINTMPWPRSEVVDIESSTGPIINDADVVLQQASNTGSNLVMMHSSGSGLTKLATTTSHPSISQATVEKTEDGKHVLNNGALRVVLDGSQVTSLYDIVNDRELIAKGGVGNKLILCDDQPLYWQAWDTELYNVDTYEVVDKGTAKITKSGPLRAEVEVTQKISDKSSITTRISLDAYLSPGNSSHSMTEDDKLSGLTFSCDVDWHEDCKFLKTEFLVDLVTDYATYETQFGAVRRATHYNTSWDVAKFEVCGHKWADLSEHSHGIALLNDSKYGYAIHGNSMRLSLLRAPKAPDAHADMGKHSFKYVLLPHEGQVDDKVVRAGYNLNHPLKGLYKDKAGVDEHCKCLEAAGLVLGNGNSDSQEKSGLILSTIKRAEDDKEVRYKGEEGLPTNYDGKSLVVRVYESLGGRSRGKLVIDGTKFATKQVVKRVVKTNLLEEEIEEVKVVEVKVEKVKDEARGKKSVGGSGVFEVPVSLGSFEVATYRVEFA